MIKTLYKFSDGERLAVAGCFTQAELNELKHEGYREIEPQVNKHGIEVR